jgi:hypothetical protein
VDPNGYVYVVDRQADPNWDPRNKVCGYSPQLTFLGFSAGPGAGNGTFHDPVGIDADAAGNSREAASAAGATLKAGAIARLRARRSHGEPDWMYPI